MTNIGNLYSATKKFTWELEKAGYKVIEKWECDFLDEIKLSKDQMLVKKLELYPYIPLEARNALYGGRTSPACLFKKIEGKEKIFYVDFTSLYPYVQKSKKFPTGHPNFLPCLGC